MTVFVPIGLQGSDDRPGSPSIQRGTLSAVAKPNYRGAQLQDGDKDHSHPKPPPSLVMADGCVKRFGPRAKEEDCEESGRRRQEGDNTARSRKYAGAKRLSHEDTNNNINADENRPKQPLKPTIISFEQRDEDHSRDGAGKKEGEK